MKAIELLYNAVAEAMGHVDHKDTEFREAMQDVASHGADAGWNGFTYYRDTCKFAENHLPAIRELLEDDASEFGQSIGDMVQGFRCLGGNVTHNEIDRCVYGEGLKGGDDAACMIGNALAWYALESVARSLSDQ
jgi:hypothetical protein